MYSRYATKALLAKREAVPRWKQNVFLEKSCPLVQALGTRFGPDRLKKRLRLRSGRPRLRNEMLPGHKASRKVTAVAQLRFATRVPRIFLGPQKGWVQEPRVLPFGPGSALGRGVMNLGEGLFPDWGTT